MYNKSDISKWKNAGNIQSQDSLRKFDPNDAIAIIGINPFTSITDRENSLVIEYKNSKIEIKTNGDIVINSSGNVKLGGELAVLGVARQTDTVTCSPDLLAWITYVNGKIGYNPLDVPPPPPSPVNSGVITIASSKVFSL
jgi:hypothetical protein